MTQAQAFLLSRKLTQLVTEREGADKAELVKAIQELLFKETNYGC